MRLISVVIGICLIPAVWSGYVGRVCGEDWPVAIGYLHSRSLTIQTCVDYCNAEAKLLPDFNIGYAAATAGEICVCSKRFNDTGNPTCLPGDDNCDDSCKQDGKPCGGDDSMDCGGQYWYSVYDAGENPNTDVIHDTGTEADRICSIGRNCSWVCNVPVESWPAELGKVYGSGSYDAKSSFCLAAAHAGKYILGTRHEVKAVRKRYATNTPLEGSWRNGIQSFWKDDPADILEFTSDDEHDNVTDVISAMIIAENGTAICGHSGSGDFNLHVHALNGSATNWTKGEGRIVGFQTEPDTIFYCGLSDAVTGMRQPSTFVPILSSYGHEKQNLVSVNGVVGDSAEIVFTEAGVIEKAGKAVSTGTTSYKIDNVTQSSSGFYRLLQTGDGDEFYQLLSSSASGSYDGIARLIVTDHELAHNCDNGGIGRADGICLCYPPFSGKYCDNICDDTLSYGSDCQWQCPTGDCEGLFVCNQDPAGCKCASGWMGPTCATPCAAGDFGPNCELQNKCKCKNNAPCNRRTGDCPEGCADGFCGATCTKQVPGIDFDLDPSNDANNELLVTWQIPQADLWDRYSARVQCSYNCSTSCNTFVSGLFSADPADELYSLTVEPYSNCEVRCAVTAKCGVVRASSSGPEAVRSSPTNDTAPPVMAKGFKAYTVDGGVLLTWEVPRGEQDHLLYYGILASYENQTIQGFGDGADDVHYVPAGTTSYLVPMKSGDNGKQFSISIFAFTEAGRSKEPAHANVTYEFSPVTPTAAPVTAKCDTNKEKTFLIVVIVFLAVVLFLLLALVIVLVFFAKRRFGSSRSSSNEYNLSEPGTGPEPHHKQSYAPASHM